MEYLMQGVGLTARPVLLGLIIYVIFIVIMLIANQKDRLKDHYWYLGEATLLIYVIAVLYITGILGGTWDSHGGNTGTFNTQFMTNESPKLMVLNFVMFVPLGVLLPATVFRSGWSFIRTSITGFLFSGCIETMQYLYAGRMADIDDIVFNTAGCMAGAVIGCLGVWFGASFAVSLLAVLWNVKYQMISPGSIVLYSIGFQNVFAEMAYYAEICGGLFGLGALIFGIFRRSWQGILVALLAIGLVAYDIYEMAGTVM